MTCQDDVTFKRMIDTLTCAVNSLFNALSRSIRAQYPGSNSLIAIVMFHLAQKSIERLRVRILCRTFSCHCPPPTPRRHCPALLPFTHLSDPIKTSTINTKRSLFYSSFFTHFLSRPTDLSPCLTSSLLEWFCHFLSLFFHFRSYPRHIFVSKMDSKGLKYPRPFRDPTWLFMGLEHLTGD